MEGFEKWLYRKSIHGRDKTITRRGFMGAVGKVAVALGGASAADGLLAGPPARNIAVRAQTRLAGTFVRALDVVRVRFL